MPSSPNLCWSEVLERQNTVGTEFLVALIRKVAKNRPQITPSLPLTEVDEPRVIW